ncbi:MAG TPA: hypothetical protein VKE92_12685 [Anaerolineales bacterium]|jgi:hypothetical protein|nr:hypothetical protein [Anaerolineales bacterium]
MRPILLRSCLIVWMAVTYMSVAGCTEANVVANKWDSGLNAPGQTRCEQVDMRDNSEMQKIFSKYDGWKLVYISEYTTQHKTGTDAAACFERAK